MNFLSKRIWTLTALLGTILVAPGLTGQAWAQPSAELGLDRLTAAPGDSLLRKDSGLLAMNDLKKDFRTMAVADEELSNQLTFDHLNPMAVTFVERYIARNGKGLQKMKEWGKGYLDMMDEVLSEYGLPRQLKYLAVIESGLKVNALSFNGAVGPWALMPAAARSYGLKVTRHYDERTDYVKSTHAAAKLLKDLYDQYGDWLLVIAAYNSGPGNVNRAIRLSGSRDFWTLQYKLPLETQNHVKKFISTHYIMEGEGGITTLTKAETAKAELAPVINLTTDEMTGSAVQSVSGRYCATVIARYVDMELPEFNRYNPGFDASLDAGNTFQLRLPADKMDIFLQKKADILNESLQTLLRASR